MSNSEEIAKAAGIAFQEASEKNPQLFHASRCAAIATNKLVDFLQSQDRDLSRAEATFIASDIIEEMPGLIGRFPNSAFMQSIRESIKNLKSQRQ